MSEQQYVVVLHRTDGMVKYAGKESWRQTDSPTRIFNSLNSARGCARVWKRNHDLPGKTNDNFVKIEIVPASIVIESGETHIIECK